MALFDEKTGKTRYLSGAENLEHLMGSTPGVRWGFPIYRCTYDSDEDWDKFMEILNERMRENLDLSKKPELYESLDWPIFEDRATFDGASKPAIREHFAAWGDSDEGQTEFQRSKVARPRVTYCIHVDAEVINAVVYKAPRPPDSDKNDIGYVNFIYAHWEPQPPISRDTTPVREFTLDEQLELDEDSPCLPEIDGTTDWDIGWMKVPLIDLLDCYTSLLGASSAGWQIMYDRPPKLARV